MKCRKCGFDNPENMKFCGKCGSKLDNLCPKCGFDNPPRFQFCGECGEKLGISDDVGADISIPKLEDMHSQLQSMIPESLAQKYVAAQEQSTGENRPITALFADISGFTPLSNSKSSEYMFQLVQDCFKQLVNIVSKYEGSISGFRGDGLLALFGAPILHENDAERAILSAIDMRNAMHDRELNVSIGVNTAMMTVGEIQTELHKEYTAYGTDINLAKRLQEYAQPGEILVGSGTHRLTRRAFDHDEMPSLELKGFTQRVTAYLLDKPKPHPEKLRGIEGLRARMVGRDREFDDLLDSTESWINGKGQIVTIIGEAGIGKSRLVAELRTHLESSEAPHDEQLILEGRCISIGQPISYWPFLDILRSWFNLSEDDSESEVAIKVKGQMESLLPDRVDDMLPFLGHLMNLQFGGDIDEQLKHYSPEQVKQGIMMRLRDIFEAISQHNRLMLILEDLHWADDLSLDLISLLMDELMAHPIMLVCVYRPEQAHNVYRLSNTAQRKCPDRYRKIELSKLSSGESRRLVGELLAIDNLPDSVRDMILAKSEGNPFFIEEVIRSLMERGLVYKENNRWMARDDVIEVQVPDTIQSVLLERIDRLEDEAKYVLQCASVIGRLFKHRLLEHVTQKQRELDGYLDQFEERDLVYPERTLPEMEYAFKHALTQEATYQGILEQRRRAFHHSVALGIERLYQERIEEFYEELAHHWEISGDKEKTLEYLMKAGEKAARNYLSEVAINYYTQAIDLAKATDISGDKLADIYYTRGMIYFDINFYEECISDMLESIGLYTQRSKRSRGNSIIARTYAWYIGDQDKALQYAHKALNDLSLEDGSSDTAFTCLNIAPVLSFSGDISPEDAEKFLKNAIEMSEQLGDKESLADYYAALDWLYAYIFGLSMQDEKYRETHEKALFHLNNIKHSLSTYAVGCINVSWLIDDPDENANLKLEAFNAGLKSGAIWAVVISANYLGEYYHDRGNVQRAIEIYEPAWSMGVKSRWLFWGFLTSIAESLIDIYVSNNKTSELLNMMQQMIDSTFTLHSKATVHPSVQGRWNETVEGIYEKLHESSIDIYHEFEETLRSHIDNTDNVGERFFYYGQLMILAVLDNQKENVRNYSIALTELEEYAGNYAKHIPPYLKHTMKVIKVSSDQGYSVIGQVLEQIDNFDDFLNTVKILLSIMGRDIILGNIDANKLNQSALDYLIEADGMYIVSTWLNIIRLYESCGLKDQLKALAEKIQQEAGYKIDEEGISQLFLEYAEFGDLGTIELFEKFMPEQIGIDWEWIDPKNDNKYNIEKNEYLQIDVFPRHDLYYRMNFDAPRLLRQIYGDFIIETKVSTGDKGVRYGGLIVWKDKDNFIRLELPAFQFWVDTIYYGANLNGRFIHPGVHPMVVESALLRIERKGDRFTGYVSTDSKNWYRCGWVDIILEDPIEVGIHAINSTSSPITSTRFEYFKIYRHK